MHVLTHCNYLDEYDLAGFAVGAVERENLRLIIIHLFLKNSFQWIFIDSKDHCEKKKI